MNQIFVHNYNSINQPHSTLNSKTVTKTVEKFQDSCNVWRNARNEKRKEASIFWLALRLLMTINIDFVPTLAFPNIFSNSYLIFTIFRLLISNSFLFIF